MADTAAETVRQACIEAAREGYQEAAMLGLCDEGALEAAISAIQNLNLDTVLASEESEQT